MNNPAKSTTGLPEGHGEPGKAEAIRPHVLSSEEIEALPMHHFSGDQCRGTVGWNNIFNAPDTPTNALNLGIAKSPPRTAEQESFLALHRHEQAEFYFILKGECIVHIAGNEYPAKPGHCLFIPGNAEHGFWNTSTTEQVVFLWGFAADGLHQVIYNFSEGADRNGGRLITDWKGSL